jgi:hypothetical protein
VSGREWERVGGGRGEPLGSLTWRERRTSTHARKRGCASEFLLPDA